MEVEAKSRKEGKKHSHKLFLREVPVVFQNSSKSSMWESLSTSQCGREKLKIGSGALNINYQRVSKQNLSEPKDNVLR